MDGTVPTIDELLTEYERARAYTDSLWRDLSPEELTWRPHPQSSAIGWHVGHQAAVAHFLVRNLTAAAPRIDPELDALMDSATPEPDRGELPGAERLLAYRTTVAERIEATMRTIERGDVGAPDQLAVIAVGVLRAIVNHEYQHDRWIGEVRARDIGRPLPEPPAADALTTIDGYVILR